MGNPTLTKYKIGISGELFQVYTMVCIYYQYKEYKEGAVRPSAAPDLVKFQICHKKINILICNF